MLNQKSDAKKYLFLHLIQNSNFIFSERLLVLEVYTPHLAV